MKYVVVCVRDRAGNVFGVPQFVVSAGAAIRSFGDGINNEAKDNPLYMHPEDFDLYSLGTYDDENGSFSGDVPKQIAVGKDFSVRSNGSGS